METIRYIHVPGSGAYIGYLFTYLTQRGKTVSEALKILNQLTAADNSTLPALPSGAELQWDQCHGLVVVAADGTAYAADHFYIPRVVLPLEQRVAKIKTAPALGPKKSGRKKRWSPMTWDIVGQAFHTAENHNREGGNLGIVNRLLAVHATQWEADGLPFLNEYLLRDKSQLRSNLLQALKRLGYR